MKPDGSINGTWELPRYSDAYYAVDNGSWKSVTGYIFLINRAVIDWRSRIQKTVTLSVTEAEYSEITYVCCEILFDRNILFYMGIVVDYLITVHVDNVGAIFMSENTSVSQQTKHIDVCHDLIIVSVEYRTMIIKFLRSEKNGRSLYKEYK